MGYTILKTAEFQNWMDGLDAYTRRLVEARIERIRLHGHFGTSRDFDGIKELKWTSGLRVYTTVKAPRVICLLGGNKNGQSKDIRRAKKILGEID